MFNKLSKKDCESISSKIKATATTTSMTTTTRTITMTAMTTNTKIRGARKEIKIICGGGVCKGVTSHLSMTSWQ